MSGIDQPACQSQPVARKGIAHRRHDGGSGSGDFFPGLIECAAQEDEGVARHGVIHDEGHGNSVFRFFKGLGEGLHTGFAFRTLVRRGLLNICFNGRNLRRKIRSRDRQERRAAHMCRLGVIARSFLRDIVKKCLEAVEITLGQRVKFVVVAAGAIERLGQPDGRRRLHSVRRVIGQKFLLGHPTFLVDHVVAIEAGGDSLRDSRVWQ